LIDASPAGALAVGDGLADAVAAVAVTGVSRPTPRDAVTMPQTTAALRNGEGAMEGSFDGGF
jgi:hypothetical protein